MKMLDKNEKDIILKVLEFCKKEKANGAPLIPLNNVRARVAAMTGISDGTVSRIFKESIQPETATTEKKPRARSKKVNIDESYLTIIRQKINEINANNKDGVTLAKLLTELKNTADFKGSRSTLWKILKQFGFKFKKCGNLRKVVIEGEDNISSEEFMIQTNV